jgi:DNA sulfur modification protein DndE
MGILEVKPMSDRLYTSFDIEKKIVGLQSDLRLSTKAAVMRIALSISVAECIDPRIDHKDEFSFSGQDKEYNKSTVLGKDETLIYAVIRQKFQKQLTEDEIFPDIIYAHIVNGVNILYNYKQNKLKNDQDLLIKLCEVALRGEIRDLSR